MEAITSTSFKQSMIGSLPIRRLSSDGRIIVLREIYKRPMLARRASRRPGP
jgi:hypothetical protein